MENLKPERSGKQSAEAGSEVSESRGTYFQQVESAREFVKKWAEAGPALEELRCQRLQELDDETARNMMLDLYSMWRSRDFDDLDAGLVEQQRILPS